MSALKRSKIPNELHVIAMFQQACAREGLVGLKVNEAAERFIDIALEAGVEIKTPKGAHLALGTVKKP